MRGRGNRKIIKEANTRIDIALRELGYIPNLATRGMQTGRASSIAIFSSTPIAVAADASELGVIIEIAVSAAHTALERNYALVLIPSIEAPMDAQANIAFDGAIELCCANAETLHLPNPEW